MGTHPIFESDFDCLTECQIRVGMTDIYENCKHYLGSGLPNCSGEQLICEISINQHTGETNRAQVIEIWQISLEDQIKDQKLKPQEVYEKQCILLKSVISLSRSLPAYQAARNQHDDNFDIKYEIYKREPDLGLLGESRGSLLVGQILTPFGGLTVSCTYRRLLGFGRPSNTPSFRYKSSSRKDISSIPRRVRPQSECSNSPGPLPPPNYNYSGSPNSVSHLSSYSSPIKARQSLGRTSSNVSTSPARSPPNLKDSPARYIPVKPRPQNAEPIDIDRPIRGAFVQQIPGSVPDSAPDIDLGHGSRYRSNSHRSLKSNDSHDRLRSQDIEDDDIFTNQSTSTSDEILLPTAGAFVRKSCAQALYESTQQPPEISSQRHYETAEALIELGDIVDENPEDEFEDFIQNEILSD